LTKTSKANNTLSEDALYSCHGAERFLYLSTKTNFAAANIFEDDDEENGDESFESLTVEEED